MDEDRNVLHSGSGRAERGQGASCNVAEYSGLIAGMEWVVGHFPEAEVTFNGDSLMVISQMRGEVKAKKGKYLEAHRRAQSLAEPYIRKKLWSFEWIARALNSQADALAQYHRY